MSKLPDVSIDSPPLLLTGSGSPMVLPFELQELHPSHISLLNGLHPDVRMDMIRQMVKSRVEVRAFVMRVRNIERVGADMRGYLL